MKKAIIPLILVVLLAQIPISLANNIYEMGAGMFTVNGVPRYLDNADYKGGIRFTARESVTVNQISIVILVTGTPPFYRFGIQNLTDEVPNGEWLGYGDYQPASGSTVYFIDISDAELLANTEYAIVIEYVNGTIDSTHRIFLYADNYYADLFTDRAMAYLDNTAGTWLPREKNVGYMLRDTDENYFGYPYYAGNEAWIYSSQNYGQKFKLKETATALGFKIFVKRASTSQNTEPLYYSLYNYSDSSFLVENRLVVEYGEVYNTYTWVNVYFDEPISFDNETYYSIYFSNSGSSSYRWIIALPTTGNNDVWKYTDDRGLGADTYGIYNTNTPPTTVSLTQDLSLRLLLLNVTESTTTGEYTVEDLDSSLAGGIILGGICVGIFLIILERKK